MAEGAESAANEEAFRDEMTESAQSMLRSESAPYEVGIALWSSMLRKVGHKDAAEFTHRAWHMWGFLTDALDGPPNYRRGLSSSEVESLMRLAAQEWLETPGDRDSIERYFDRWDEWPDSIRGE